MRKLCFPILLTCLLLAAACGTQKKMPTPGTPLPERHEPTDTTETAKIADIKLPAKDLRAVWIATIGGLDWPRGNYDELSQKALYEQYLDTLQRLNINAVFFQIRPRADAFYKSSFEPWSMYLTWRRDKDPGYDVLRWLIDETHRRGIAFHAWMNPYRIGTRKGRKDKFAPLDSRIPKQLVKDYANVRIYNPAMPETRQRICDIVADLLARYDVDGIHFDDYFYPALAKGEKMNDTREYKKYGHGFARIENFRRAMVDSLVLAVGHTIKAVRPNVVFSISPQGNYQNNYDTMYADVAKWSKHGWCDVVIPQLYWSTKKYFPERLQWFADSCSQNTTLAIGYALYRFDGKSRDPYYSTTDDLVRQFSMAYGNSNVSGAALYSAHWLIDNPMNINAVIARQFPRPTLLPYLGHGEEAKPDSPQNASIKAFGGSQDSITLSWQSVPRCYYAVYRIPGKGCDAELVAITYNTSCVVPAAASYCVTAVRKGDNAESTPALFLKSMK